jgi:hypothetical protein
MLNTDHHNTSPMRLLEALTDRFGVFEALATATIQLARHDPEPDLPMDPQVAEAVLEFGDDLRGARAAANRWARTRGHIPDPRAVAEAA